MESSRDSQKVRTPIDLYAGLSAAQVRLKSQLAAMRPELAAGGFPRDDGTVQFYTRVNALLSVDMTLLDFGAGRGRQFDIPDAGYREAIQKFQGKVAKVIGVDVHEAIHDHPYLDERHVIAKDTLLPLSPGTVDIVVADWVLEHLENPSQFAGEMERVVRPGGWVCARTINRWGYVGIGARMIPNSVHARIVQKLIPVARSADVFPVYYRANCPKDIRRCFSRQNWDDFSYLVNTTPRYFANSRTFFRMTELYQKVVPYGFRTDFFVFLRRK